ncbi:putative reverse transcriptase domain-containing protein [Tanacetum coccineum]
MRAASPPLLLPSTSYRIDIPEAEMLSRKRDCSTTPAFGFEDTDEFYVRFKDAQDDRAFLKARVNALFRDRQFHHHTTMLLDRETTYARRAWTGSEDRSASIEAHVRTLETLEARDPEPQDEPAKACSSSPKRRTATTTTTSTPMTDAQIEALIERGIAAALAERDAERSRNGDESHDSGTGGRRHVSTVRECTYIDFLNCQPLNFKGTEGVVGLTQWLEKMKSVFHISNCTVACQVKFATCTLQGNSLTWWMFPKESDEVEKYAGGLPDMIHGSVKASNPKTMQEEIEFATELMDQKILTLTERQAEKKRKFDDTSRNNQNQQQPFKRNNVAWAYTVGPGEKKPYGGSKPLCPKFNYHYDRQCAPKCTNCKRIGHSARDCKSQPAAANNNQRA